MEARACLPEGLLPVLICVPRDLSATDLLNLKSGLKGSSLALLGGSAALQGLSWVRICLGLLPVPRDRLQR